MVVDEDDTTDDEEGREYESIEVKLYSLNLNSGKQIPVDVFPRLFHYLFRRFS